VDNYTSGQPSFSKAHVRLFTYFAAYLTIKTAYRDHRSGSISNPLLIWVLKKLTTTVKPLLLVVQFFKQNTNLHEAKESTVRFSYFEFVYEIR